MSEFIFNQNSSQLLPIQNHKAAILYSLEKHRVLILVGETGCGKSTQLPQILHSAGIYNNPNSKNEPSTICITQPRRIAAVRLAERVSRLMGTEIGTVVGYTIRHNDATTRGKTEIKFVTEGILLREIFHDPCLEQYSVIIVDEAHERSVQTDIILGLLKCILLKRKDLKVIICSATLNVNTFENFFSFENIEKFQIDDELKKPALLFVDGKSHPTTIFYKKESVSNYLDACVETAINLHESNRLASGKILIFMIGQDEVEYVTQQLKEYAHRISLRLDVIKLIVLPLYASIDSEQAKRVFEPHGRGKRVCIVSTNVAETSLTIDDVAFVIDCGFTKIRLFDPRTGIDALVKVPISKASAKQRAGRAGRTRDGVVYRLYTEEVYQSLLENCPPEIQRCQLSEVILLLKSLGIDNVTKFPLVSPMPRENLTFSLELLFALGALDESGSVTDSGLAMSKFATDPKLSKILVSNETKDCSMEAIKIVAMLQVDEIFIKPGKYATSLWSNPHLTEICSVEGDLISYLNIFNSFIESGRSSKWALKRNLNANALNQAAEIAKRLEGQLKTAAIKLKSCNGRVEMVQKSLTSGLFMNAACLSASGEYRTIKGDKTVHVHPLSFLSGLPTKPKYVVYVEILNTTKSYMRHLIAIKHEWLLEVAPHYYNWSIKFSSNN